MEGVLLPLGSIEGQTFRMRGHRDWVTCMATSFENTQTIVSGSRDKRLIMWQLTGDPSQPAYARRSMGGHNGAVADVVISSDGLFALTASWDHTMRLWDLASGVSIKTFGGNDGHKKDVLAVAFSSDCRQIVSGSRDRTIKLWNTLAECKWTVTDGLHTDWVSSVRFSPNAKSPTIVSSSWDSLVKVWTLPDFKLKYNMMHHSGPIYSIAIAPDGTLCASGGRDKTMCLWDVNEGKLLFDVDAGEVINGLAFSPCNYWVVGVCDHKVVIWNLEDRSEKGVIQYSLEDLDNYHDKDKSSGKECSTPLAVSVCWNAEGTMLFVGMVDGSILTYEVRNY